MISHWLNMLYYKRAVGRFERPVCSDSFLRMWYSSWKVRKKLREKFDFSLTSQNLIECLLCLLSLYPTLSAKRYWRYCPDSEIFCFWPHIFTTNAFQFRIKYPFKSNIPIREVTLTTGGGDYKIRGGTFYGGDHKILGTFYGGDHKINFRDGIKIGFSC